MKLVHFSDLHLGIENYGTLDPRTGLSTRVSDFLRVLDEVIDFAIAEQVDAVLFAGDAFKNRDPNPTIQRAFARRVRRLAAAEIPTVLLIGNHDLPAIWARATAIEIYEALEIPNIYVGRKVDRLTVPTRGGPLQVVTVPWISRSQFLTRDEIRELSAEEIQRRMAENLASAVETLVQELDPSLPAVLLGHLSIEGARLGSEQSIMLGEDLVLGTEELQVRAFDYVALGHIHQHQQITQHPPTVYAGSLERIDFGEEREEKGFVVVEIDAGPAGKRATRWAFHPVHARPFLTLRVKATHDDPMDDVEAEIARRRGEIEGAIVRAIVSLPAEREGLLRLVDVRRLLQEAGAAYVAKVVRDVDSTSRPRLEVRDHEALDPVAMLERWLEVRGAAPEHRKKVLERGRALIREARGDD